MHAGNRGTLTDAGLLDRDMSYHFTRTMSPNAADQEAVTVFMVVSMDVICFKPQAPMDFYASSACPVWPRIERIQTQMQAVGSIVGRSDSQVTLK